MSNEQENPLIAERRRKLDGLRERGQAFPNDFRKDSQAASLHDEYGEWDNERLEAADIRVAVAGRMMAKRVMGKVSFVRLQDATGSIQLFLARDGLPDGLYQEFKTWDVGDILGAAGCLFRTKTGELSVRVDALRILTKSLRPLPEKYHGLTDQETRYRQRYVDLIMSEDSRRVFTLRTRMVAYMRQYLDSREFCEVETPMMQTLPGGANARPFVTHHNALGLDMYLRIAPELYLKRLVVGGMEKVYEINRNFRNEGLSTRHNPEFTMLEVYWAYVGDREMMDLTEEMLRGMAESVTQGTSVDYQGRQIDFGPDFERLTMEQALLRQDPELEADRLRDPDYLRERLSSLGVEMSESAGPGVLMTELFEQVVESELYRPTFITAFPAEVSPLARRSDEDPFVTDRFELFIAGREIANGFSELNDPEEQAARFSAQVEKKSQGDEEAMYFDADYIRALEYAMPPTGGLGVGVDRLVMLLTDSQSIRDVLLFPHLRPEDPSAEADQESDDD